MKNTLLLFLLFLLTFNANSQIVINEINYKDAIDFPTKDWIELYNNSSNSIDISNWVFKDSDDLHEFVIPNGTVMESGSYLVLVQFLADFQAMFPGVSPVIGDFEFGLSGGGELIRLFNDSGVLIDSVEYSDMDPWPTEPDGNGPTLELIDPAFDNAVASSWGASIPPDGLHGTPGQLNSVSLLGVENFDELSFSIYPNPLVSSSTIKISNIENTFQLILFDVLGKEIKRINSISNEFIIRKDNLESGVYLIQISSINGLLKSTKKLIVK